MDTTPAVDDPALAARWQRIAAHPFEDPALPLDFTARLAREQGWTRAEARAAIAEYRRYCWLACAGFGPMTPAVAVDEVWHLHLTYTRDYWERWCGIALGVPLHHEPTGGTRADRHRYAAQYAATLAAYARCFGDPPVRWWPDPAERFADPARIRRVDTARTWLLPRPRWPRLRGWPARFAALLAAAIGGPAQAALPSNPYDWPAGAFLGGYAALVLAAFALSLVWRRMLRENGASPTPPADPIEIAYLADGTGRATDAAVVEAVNRGVLALDEARGRLVVSGAISTLPAPVDAVAKLVAVDGDPATLPARARPMFAPVARALERRGLTLDAASAWRARWQPAAIASAVLLFGLVRIGIGLARERPVGLLVLLCAGIAIHALVLLVRRPHRSRAGDRALAALVARHRTLARAPRAQDWPLAVALAGTAALAATPLAAYHQLRHPPGSGDGGGPTEAGGDGDGAGGGGGSGCGGCGGGGD